MPPRAARTWRSSSLVVRRTCSDRSLVTAGRSGTSGAGKARACACGPPLALPSSKMSIRPRSQERTRPDRARPRWGRWHGSTSAAVRQRAESEAKRPVIPTESTSNPLLSTAPTRPPAGGLTAGHRAFSICSHKQSQEEYACARSANGPARLIIQAGNRTGASGRAAAATRAARPRGERNRTMRSSAR